MSPHPWLQRHHHSAALAWLLVVALVGAAVVIAVLLLLPDPVADGTMRAGETTPPVTFDPDPPVSCDEEGGCLIEPLYMECGP